MQTRPLSAVPRPVLLMLALCLALQVGWQVTRARPAAQAETLGPPPSLATLRLASLGEPAAVSRVMMLSLQAYDDQPGISLSWQHMDYAMLRLWLERALDLDPRGQMPLFAASELYSAVNDPARVRTMLDLVYQRFGEDPAHRWPWLAQATLVARHRLHDLPLARRYAAAIRTNASAAPLWARELEAFILEDMNELDSARLLIGALIKSGQISDPNELRFLERRLDEIKARQLAKPP